MKIVAPVRAVSEVEMLLHFGADELYCGIATPEWEQHFKGLWWMNRRDPEHANLHSIEDIEKVLEIAHSHQVPVHLALNAPFYSKGSRRYLLKLIDKMVNKFNIDALIISDMMLMFDLSLEKFPVKIHLSSLGSCFNSNSAEFYRSLGVKRIILPRQLRAGEIKRIVADNQTDMEFELFAINDGCYFEEGFCQTTHGIGPFCMANYHSYLVNVLDKDIPVEDDLQQKLKKKVKDYIWYQNNCGSSYQEQGLPNGPCSLCFFGYFRDWGVTAVKIAGREASFLRKCASIQIVKSIIDDVRDGCLPAKIASNAKDLRGTPSFCTSGYMCYFRDPDFEK